jgi:hypothetical protein
VAEAARTVQLSGGCFVVAAERERARRECIVGAAAHKGWPFLLKFNGMRECCLLRWRQRYPTTQVRMALHVAQHGQRRPEQLSG